MNSAVESSAVSAPQSEPEHAHLCPIAEHEACVRRIARAEARAEISATIEAVALGVACVGLVLLAMRALTSDESAPLAVPYGAPFGAFGVPR